MFRSFYIKALDDYKKARRRADLEALLARISGSAGDDALLSYDQVRSQLQAIEKSPQRLKEIPLNSIVGSVGRYRDFTRKYLPKSSIDQKRWARVMATSQDLEGLPPIEVYQIGEVYFVRDGNHRVSVARQMGNPTIQAYVTQVESKVDLSPNTTPDDLIIKSEQVKFLERTKLDQLRPDSDLSATKAGAYPTLLEHISVHRYYMGLEQEREIPFQEAAADWYDRVFRPVISLIIRRDLLKDFPDRTATDMYLWAADHRARLEDHLGWEIGAEAAINDLSDQHRPDRKSLRHLFSQLLEKITPDRWESGPPPGTWRERLTRITVLQHLFNDLIVALDDSENAWYALEMAGQLAQLENSRIHGIHVHPSTAESREGNHRSLQEQFTASCQESGISDYDFQVSAGEIGTVLCEHSKFADLIVLPLNYPPGEKPIQRLSSGLSAIIRSCPIPVLTVPVQPTGLTSILLAFDGSLKAREALYIAAYFGSQHGSEITVLTSTDGLPRADQIQDQAKTYLRQFPIHSQYILSSQPLPLAITRLRTETKIDLIMIGGYGGSFLVDVVLGSVVDQVLREIHLPILICR